MASRICLISPGHVSYNPRLVKEADALSEAGYDVHVVSANVRPELRSLDEPILRAARWSSHLVGGDNRAIDFLRRARSKFARDIVVPTIAHRRAIEWSHHELTDALCRTALTLPAELYIAHYIAALPAAFHAARCHEAKWAFDAEDFHSGEFEESEASSQAATTVRMFERTYLPHAAYLTAASRGIADAYDGLLGGKKAEPILNVFPLRQAPVGPTAAGSVRPGPSIYWFSQTIGRNRGLECAVSASAKASSQPHLYLRGNFQAGFDAALNSLAQSLGIADRIHVLPTAFATDMERLAADYDLGFVGETGHSPNRKIALTNKLFSYLLAGLPVLATDIPAHRAISAQCDAIDLFPVDDSDQLAGRMDAVLLHPDKLASARRVAFDAGQTTFNWDIEKHKLLALVAAHIGEPR